MRTDYIICAVRDKHTGLLGNVFQSRNTVELERDMYRVVHNERSPYKDFESDFELCILANYDIREGLSINDNIVVYKNLSDIKNLNMNDREVFDGTED